jgi:hypothetical protein
VTTWGGAVSACNNGGMDKAANTAKILAPIPARYERHNAAACLGVLLV